MCIAGAVALPASAGAASRAAGASAGVRALPSNFIWGVSSSAFQSEGGNVDDNWHLYVRQHPTFDPYKNSVDFLHRYPQDIALAKGLGVNTYRIGINWARVEPRRGHFDSGALRYYDSVIRTMVRDGIHPLITLDHWTYPMWVYRQGSWASTRTVDDFISYVRVIARRYHRLVHRWLTFNEAAFYRLVETNYRPLTAAQADAMTTNLIAAHRRAYDVIHRDDPGARVSSNIVWVPGTTAVSLLGAVLNTSLDPFLKAVADKLDYIALDYYYPGYQASDLIDTVTTKAFDAQIAPFGIYEAVRVLSRRFPHKPILITENGMPTDNGFRADHYLRSQQLRDTVYWVQRARDAGVQVIGYMYWSLTDNYEFGSYASRFGLYTVNVLTDPSLRRIPTDAVAAYRTLIRKRGDPSGYRLTRRPIKSDCALVNALDRSACLAAS